MYSRGPLAWKQWTLLSRVFGGGEGGPGGGMRKARRNKESGSRASRKGGGGASQEFVPSGRQLINRGQVAGEAISIVAEGTYQPQVGGEPAGWMCC